VRTTTALTTSPFFTPAPGMASFTVATMMSPMPAYRRPEPPSTRMHRISRAPVLSATRNRVSCWITSISYVCQFSGASRRSLAELRPRFARPDLPLRPSGQSLGPFEDLHDPPPLGGGQRAGLHQQHPVADAARVLLVVRLQLAGSPHHLAVQRMLHLVLDRDDNGLVHLVADHQALTHLAAGARSLLSLTHDVSTTSSSVGAADRPSSRSRMMV